MADANLGVATLRTRLDSSGIRAGLTVAKNEADQALGTINTRLGTLSREFELLGTEVKAGLAPAQQYLDVLNKQEGELRQLASTLDRTSDEYRQTAQQLAAVKQEQTAVTQTMQPARVGFEQVAGAAAAAGAALFATRGLIIGYQRLAEESERATNANIIFQKQLVRSNVDTETAGKLVDRLSTRFGVLPQTVQEAATLMLRAGGSLEDVERALTAAGASAAATGFDISTSFDNVATAVATGRSELLETSGIVANLGPVQQAYAKQLGKTVEELTEAELVQARVNAIYEESKAEIEDVDQLLSGLVGTQSATRSEWKDMRQEIGERLLPVFIGLHTAIGGIIGAFNDLPEPVQEIITTVGLMATTMGVLGTGIAGVVVAIRPLLPALAGMRAALLPFIGPAGILIGAVVGYQLLTRAMNAGQEGRQQASADFRDLVRTMGAYRDQLVITSEEERAQLTASLEHRRQALERTLQMQEAYVDALRSDVAAFADKGFFGQILGLSEFNINNDALENAEAELEVLQQTIAGIDTQIGEVRDLEITVVPNVEPPPGVDPADDTTDALGLPRHGSTRTITLRTQFEDPGMAEMFTLQAAERSLGRSFFSPRDAIGGLGELGITLTPALLDALDQRYGPSGERSPIPADQRALMRERAALDPGDLSGGLTQAEIAQFVAEANERERERVQTEATRAASLLVNGLVRSAENVVESVLAELERLQPQILSASLRTQAQMSLDRQAEIDSFTFRDPRLGRPDNGTQVVGGGVVAAHQERIRVEQEALRVADGLTRAEERLNEARRIAEQRYGNTDAQLRLTINALEQTEGQFTSMDDALDKLMAANVPVTDELYEAIAALLEFRRSLEGISEEARQTLALGTRLRSGDLGGLSPEDLRLGAGMGILMTGPDGVAGAEAAGEVLRGGAEDVGRTWMESAADFANSVRSAGSDFANAIEAFSEGNIGGGIAGLGQAASGILGGLGGLGLGASLGPIGMIVSAGAGLLGGLVNLFTGGGDDEQEAQAAAEARRRSVPAIHINFTMNQSNTYNGGPADPANENAFRRQASIAIEEFMNRTRLVQRVAALEGTA